LAADHEQWLVLTVRPSSAAQIDAVTEGLLFLGGSAVQETNGELISYFPPTAHLNVWLERARQTLGSEFAWHWQADEDWAQSWKRGLQPRRVGRNFIVAPSWTTPTLRDGDRVIVIDPEMAFGTGEHATTRGALRFIEQYTKAGDRVLDVGTGSAILAIGAALCGAAEVLAVEYDEDAVLNARDNIQRNRVAARIRLETALVDDAYLRARGDAAFDIISANVLSGVLLPLLPSFFRSLAPSGYLILGGILESEADDMIAAAQHAGFTLLTEDLEEEWWGGLLRRPA
jgi:ribosomal protein L11 methyltransferase